MRKPHKDSMAKHFQVQNLTRITLDVRLWSSAMEKVRQADLQMVVLRLYTQAGRNKGGKMRQKCHQFFPCWRWSTRQSVDLANNKATYHTHAHSHQNQLSPRITFWLALVPSPFTYQHIQMQPQLTPPKTTGTSPTTKPQHCNTQIPFPKMTAMPVTKRQQESKW